MRYWLLSFNISNIQIMYHFLLIFITYQYSFNIPFIMVLLQNIMTLMVKSVTLDWVLFVNYWNDFKNLNELIIGINSKYCVILFHRLYIFLIWLLELNARDLVLERGFTRHPQLSTCKTEIFLRRFNILKKHCHLLDDDIEIFVIWIRERMVWKWGIIWSLLVPDEGRKQSELTPISLWY